MAAVAKPKPFVMAKRRTFDGTVVVLWNDGDLTTRFGFFPRGAGRLPLELAWLVVGELELYDWAELPALIKAARVARKRLGPAASICDVRVLARRLANPNGAPKAPPAGEP